VIDDDAFVSAATADACFIVHLIGLFMKTHLLVLLQDTYLDLVRSAFLCKLSGCMRNITADIGQSPLFLLKYHDCHSRNLNMF